MMTALFHIIITGLIVQKLGIMDMGPYFLVALIAFAIDLIAKD